MYSEKAAIARSESGEKSTCWIGESERTKTAAGYEVLRRKEETSNAYALLYESMSVKNLKADGKSRNAFSSSMRRNLAHDSCVQLDAREDPWGGCFRFQLSVEREEGNQEVDWV